MTKTKMGVSLALVAVLTLGVWQSVQAASKKSSNIVKVHSCTQVGNDIHVKLKGNLPAMTLKAGCSNAGYGLRDYAFTCISDKQYKVEWEACPVTGSISQLMVSNLGTGTTLGVANSSYLTLGGKYAAKQVVTVPDTVSSLQFALHTKNPTSTSGQTYAFVWTDSATGASNFNESLAKSLVANANFSTGATTTLSVTDYYRGRHVTLVGFVRNNDGLSKVPNMPVEVDDVVAIHLKFAPKMVCEDVSGGDANYNLCLGKMFTHSSGATVGYASYYHNAVGLTINGSAQKFVVSSGKTLSFLSPDQKTQINVHVKAVSKTTARAQVRVTSQPAPLSIQ